MVLGGCLAGITYLYYDGPVLWPFGWGLSYTTFQFEFFDNMEAHKTVDAKAYATGQAQPPAYAVNVTNTGTVVSDVSALGFYSTGLPTEPVEELFDFQRTASLAPGETRTLYFTLPPEVVATVNEAGEQTVQPGVFTVRIGDVRQTGNYAEGSLTVTGEAFTMFSLRKIRAEYEARQQ